LPSELSGGQQQRVALARALAHEPRVLLLDEPFGALDAKIREELRRAIREIQRAVGITTMLVTHEQDEAFDLGDRVALLHDGRLDQIGTPRELYRRPATRFVAAFIGRASFVRVELAESDGTRAIVRGPGFRPGATVVAAPSGLERGEAADLWLRPEMLELVADGAAGATFSGTVQAVRYSGATSFATVRLPDGEELEVALAGDAEPVTGNVGVALRPGASPRLFPPGSRP